MSTSSTVRQDPAPHTVGLASSFGLGDRLGLATPGHIAGLRRVAHGVIPVLAQQSARELGRTGRSYVEVLDAARRHAANAHWDEPFGADADHLKAEDQVAAAVAAGFTMYTLDPSDMIDTRVSRLDPRAVWERFDELDLAPLEATSGDLVRRYKDGIELEVETIAPTQEEIARAALTFARAIDHVAELADRVPMWADLEVSIDETETPTSRFEHAFVVSELARRNVRPTSVALRFPGRFEKGIEFVGQIEAFEQSVREHASVARALGPYKLSLHSGSDKLSVYRRFVEATGGRFHIKTSGTWYLEALRVAVTRDPALGRSIWGVALRDYEMARRSYDVTAEIRCAPSVEADNDLERLLDDPVARRILHVTYGSVLGDEVLRSRLCAVLVEDGGDAYTQAVRDRTVSHLAALRA